MKKDIVSKAMYTLGDMARSRNMNLRPLGSSLVDGLAITLRGALFSGKDYPNADEYIARSTQKNCLLGSYESVMAEGIKSEHPTLSAILKLAANEINPRVIEVKEAAEAFIEETLASDYHYSPTAIEIYEPYKLMVNDMFVAAVGKYREAPIVIRDVNVGPSVVAYLKQILIDDSFPDALMSGSPSLDSAIRKDIDAINERRNRPDRVRSDIEDICDSIDWMSFNPGGSTEDSANMWEFSKLLPVYLLVSNLLNGKMPEQTAMLDENKMLANCLLQVRATSARLLYAYIDVYGKAISNGDIIVPPSMGMPDRQRIGVIGPTYRKWLTDQGGSPEVLMGWIMVHTRGDKRDDLMLPEHREKYLETYVRHQQMRDIALSNARITQRQKAFWVQAGKMIDHHADFTPAERTNMLKTLADFMETQRKMPTRCMYSMGIEFFSKHWCQCEDAYGYLREMDAILNKEITSGSPEERLNQASTLAVYRLVGRWVASQIDVSKGV